jgi:hypothetical protein
MTIQRPIPSTEEAQLILKRLSIRLSFMAISMDDGANCDMDKLYKMMEKDVCSVYSSCFGRIDN